LGSIKRTALVQEFKPSLQCATSVTEKMALNVELLESSFAQIR